MKLLLVSFVEESYFTLELTFGRELEKIHNFFKNSAEKNYKKHKKKTLYM